MPEFKKKLQERLHMANLRVNKGFNYYIYPYLMLASLIALPSMLIAKLFPDLTIGAGSMAILSFAIMVFVSWWLGERHEKIDAETNGHTEETK